jgi:acetylornithine deacetylase/succinyl-diaminopimelate desuccinylase-like protein
MNVSDNLVCCFVSHLQAFICSLVYFSTDDCVAFLKKQAVSLGLPLKVYSVVSGKPIVVLTWEGSEPHLPSVLLNSHMDVVPVYPVSTGHT